MGVDARDEPGHDEELISLLTRGDVADEALPVGLPLTPTLSP